MKNRLILAAVLFLSPTIVAQAPAVKPPALPKEAPIAPAVPPFQTVQPTSEEAAILSGAYANLENAQLRLQLIVSQVQLRHPGWQYDYDKKSFFMTPTPAQRPTPAASPSSPVPAAPVKR